MKSKKIISIVMTSAMMTSMFPVASYAETPTDVGTVVETRAARSVTVESETTLITAITNATDGTTIQLTKSFDLSNNLTIDQEKNITLDLNGQTLNLEKKKISVKGTLTVEDNSQNANGSISGTANQLISVDGTLTLKSGKIETTAYGAVRTSTTGTFNMTGGTVVGAPAVQALSGKINITGGNVNATETSRYLAIVNSNAAITIGTENATDKSNPNIQGIAVGTNKVVTLHSGYISALSGSVATGSTLKSAFGSDITSSLPAGMVSVLEDGIYVVKDITDETKVATVINSDGTVLSFGSVQAAVNALTEGATLTLYKDVEVTSNLPAIDIRKANVILDLNGHNVTCTNASENGVTAYGVSLSKCASDTFVIKNSSENPATITGYNAAVHVTTNISLQTVKFSIDGNVNMVATKADAPTISLGNAALVYSEEAAKAVANGGFKATNAEGETFIYGTASAAIDADVNNTAVLLNDYTGTTSLAVAEGETAVIDLNGHTFTTTASSTISANGSNSNLTVKNGNVVSNANASGDNWPSGVDVFYNPGELGGSPTYYENVDITLENVNITLNNQGYGVVVYGNDSNIDITLKDSTINTDSTSIGIYFPPTSGNLIVENSNVTGGTGIAIKGGNLIVRGDSVIKGSGVANTPSTPNGSGTNETGDAIYVEGNYNRAVNVTVESGSIISDNGHPLQKLFDENAAEGQEKEILVKGGNFSEPVEEAFLDKTLTTMLTSRSNPEAPISYYASAQEASKNAQPGDKVESVDNTATTYTATIKFGTGAADLVYELTEGSSFNLPAAPTKNGYTFLGWTDGTNNYQAGAFIKLTGNMTIEAVWREIPEYNGKYSYEVFTEVGDNGSIKVDKYATEGDKITITVSPDEAYMLDDMTITSNGKEVEFEDNGDGTYTFTMPSGDVKIEVTFAEDPNWEPKPEEPTMPFNDVNENDWFYGAVEYVHDNGLMNGVSENEFAPQMKLTRAMMVSVLANLEGASASDGNSFSDVPDNAWYADAVSWAATVGVTNGFEDGTFRPNDSLTREQMAAMLYNYAAYKGYDLTAVGDLSQFADADQISAWAEDVVSWAVGADILHGMGNDMLSPTGTATRAEVAAVLANYCENVAK